MERTWNGKHFSGTRPETAPGENHHAPGGLASRSRSVPLVPPQRGQAQPPPCARPLPSPAPHVRLWGRPRTAGHFIFHHSLPQCHETPILITYSLNFTIVFLSDTECLF